jgi:hypothetical protein
MQKVGAGDNPEDVDRHRTIDRQASAAQQARRIERRGAWRLVT